MTDLDRLSRLSNEVAVIGVGETDFAQDYVRVAVRPGEDRPSIFARRWRSNGPSPTPAWPRTIWTA